MSDQMPAIISSFGILQTFPMLLSLHVHLHNGQHSGVSFRVDFITLLLPRVPKTIIQDKPQTSFVK